MTTLLILSGFYIIWLAALLTVAYTPRLFHNYTLFKAINSILFVVISVLAWRHSGMNMFTYWPRLPRSASLPSGISPLVSPITATVPPVPLIPFPVWPGLAFSPLRMFSTFCSSPSSAPCGGITLFCLSSPCWPCCASHGTPLFTSVGIPDPRASSTIWWSHSCSQSGLMSPLPASHGRRCSVFAALSMVGHWVPALPSSSSRIFSCFPSTFTPAASAPVGCASSISPPTILDSSCWHSASYCKPAIHISSALCYGSRFLFLSARGPHSASPSDRTSASLRTILARSAGAPPLFYTKKRVPLIGTLSFI